MLIQILSESSTPLSGKELSKRLDISRQVIVQDMALLRAQDHEILSTNQGYLLTGGKKISRVFKVIHSDKEVEEFLQDLQNGHSALLKNITSEYHYHTVSAPSERLLDLIQDKLQEKGFLAELKDYEPINFREKEKENE